MSEWGSQSNESPQQEQALEITCTGKCRNCEEVCLLKMQENKDVDVVRSFTMPASNLAEFDAFVRERERIV